MESSIINNVYETLIEVRAVSGAIDKRDRLAELDNDFLKWVLIQATSPYITFNIKAYDFDEPVGKALDYDREFCKQQVKEIKRLCNQLAARELTGNAAKEAVFSVSGKLDEAGQYILSCILDKDLKCGLNVKSVNKVFPNLIPVFEVQLANKDTSKIKFPALAEIKSNGRRNVAIVRDGAVKHYSRNGKEVPNFSFLNEQLLQLAEGEPVVFDGEVRGKEGSHIEQYKAVQEVARRKEDIDVSGLVYVVWDCIPLRQWANQESGLYQQARTRSLKERWERWIENVDDEEEILVKISKGWIVNNEEEMMERFEKALAQKQEGLIIKDLEAPYQFKRSNAWIKLKCENDEDLPIVDFVERIERGVKTGILGAIVVDRSGVKVHAPCGKGITHEDARKLWEDRKNLLGKTAKVNFMNVTADGALYLPKFVEIRDDK